MHQRRFAFMAALMLATIGCSAAAVAEEVTQHQGRSVAAPETAGVMWAGYAVSPNGRVFREENGSEAQARVAAKSECELRIGRTCHAIAVPTTWFVSAISCAGVSFVAGSKDDAAIVVARRKAQDAGMDDDRCREIYNY